MYMQFCLEREIYTDMQVFFDPLHPLVPVQCHSEWIDLSLHATAEQAARCFALL